MGLFTGEIFSILKVLQEDNTNKSLCMMGKQKLIIDWSFLENLITQYGIHYNMEEFEKSKGDPDIDSFVFFKIFGFTEVHAADISPYEGADIILDLNKKLPSDLYQRFDYVVDGGTLEHVFDPATALKNMANMVKRGGYIFHQGPVAGLVNHGFYSFSPILFSEFYKANGFEIKQLELCFRTRDSKTDLEAFSPSVDCRIISNDVKDINGYILKMYTTSGDPNMQTMLWCSAKKKDNADVGVHPIQVFDKLQPAPGWEKNVIQFLQENQGKEIVLYGKGRFCDKLLDELFKNDLEGCIKCIFDSFPRKAGTTHRGYKVFCPTEAKLKTADIILISNAKNIDEIYSILSGFGTEITSKVYKLSQF